MAQRVCVARILGPHGLRGEVRLKSFTADPLALKEYGRLQSADGTANFEIEALRPGGSHLVARLTGIADRDAAERLSGSELYVPRERLPETEPDEFYHADLIGLLAVTPDGREIGEVTAVHDFGAGDILELRSSGAGTVLMLPFTEMFVPRIDIAGGRITVV